MIPAMQPPCFLQLSILPAEISNITGKRLVTPLVPLGGDYSAINKRNINVGKHMPDRLRQDLQ
jgi:hypothetical protein